METGSEGIPIYAALVAVAAIVAHSVWRHYLGASIVTAVICSIINFADNVRRAEVIDPTILGFGPMELIAGVVVAFPICLLVGIPFARARLKRRDAESSHPTLESR